MIEGKSNGKKSNTQRPGERDYPPIEKALYPLRHKAFLLVEAGKVEFTFVRKMPLIAVKKVSHCKDSTIFQ